MTEEVPYAPEPESAEQPADRLESWKEVAAYLKRGVRTVQRWERVEALPVHRHRHDKRGTVYAFRREIDAWRENRRQRIGRRVAADASRPGWSGERIAAALGNLFRRHRKARLATSLAALILFALVAAVAWIKIQAAAG
jgi:hypothetical protein